MPSDTIHLSRLMATHENISHVQAVLEATPRYSIAISGKTTPSDAGASVFTSRPPRCSEENKWVLGVMRGEEMIGVIDLIRGYPQPAVAYVGLLAIKETHQRQGLGRAAFREVEKLIATWQECERLRLSIVRTNPAAIRFWSALGFSPAGQTVPYQNGAISSEAVVIEKAVR